jgi:hypothetical protein
MSERFHGMMDAPDTAITNHPEHVEDSVLNLLSIASKNLQEAHALCDELIGGATSPYAEKKENPEECSRIGRMEDSASRLVDHSSVLVDRLRIILSHIG